MSTTTIPRQRPPDGEILYTTLVVDGEVLDLVLIDRALAGDHPENHAAAGRLSRAEKREAIRRGHQRGLAVSRIAMRLRTNNEDVETVLFGTAPRGAWTR